ncbi:MAG: hypothetical protein AB1465_03010 [Patescibacteria group bacterium]
MSTKQAWARDFRKFLEFRAYQNMRRTPEILVMAKMQENAKKKKFL